MFIDYVTLLLANMSIGMTLLGIFLIKPLNGADSRSWAPPFLVAGLIAFTFGMHMAVTYPLPGAYNLFFGETSVLLGAIFLGVGLSSAMNRPITPLAPMMAISSVVAVILGARILNMAMTSQPLMSGAGFILSGISGLLTACAVLWSKNRGLRLLAAILLFACAALWLFVAAGGYWMHAETLNGWQPR